MDPERVETISSWPRPRSFHDIQVFLGFCNFYRRFIKGYSRIARPLNNLLKGMENGRKPRNVELGADEVMAFEGLKSAFQEAPLLHHFDPSLPIRLETDASDFALSAILSDMLFRLPYVAESPLGIPLRVLVESIASCRAKDLAPRSCFCPGFPSVLVRMSKSSSLPSTGY